MKVNREVSILVPTYKSPDNLNNLYDSLRFLKQYENEIDIEFIFAFQSYSDEFVEEYVKRFSKQFPIKYLTFGEGIGLTEPYNRCLELSEKEFVYFTDDDIYFCHESNFPSLFDMYETIPKCGIIMSARSPMMAPCDKAALPSWKLKYSLYGRSLHMQGGYLMKRSLFKQIAPLPNLEHFDELYMNYFIWLLGYRNIVTPYCRLIHDKDFKSEQPLRLFLAETQGDEFDIEEEEVNDLRYRKAAVRVSTWMRDVFDLDDGIAPRYNGNAVRRRIDFCYPGLYDLDMLKKYNRENKHELRSLHQNTLLD